MLIFMGWSAFAVVKSPSLTPHWAGAASPHPLPVMQRTPRAPLTWAQGQEETVGHCRKENVTPWNPWIIQATDLGSRNSKKFYLKTHALANQRIEMNRELIQFLSSLDRCSTAEELKSKCMFDPHRWVYPIKHSTSFYYNPSCLAPAGLCPAIATKRWCPRLSMTEGPGPECQKWPWKLWFCSRSGGTISCSSLNPWSPNVARAQKKDFRMNSESKSFKHFNSTVEFAFRCLDQLGRHIQSYSLRHWPQAISCNCMFFVMFLWCCFMLFHGFLVYPMYPAASATSMAIQESPNAQGTSWTHAGAIFGRPEKICKICQNMSKLSHIRWNILQCHWSSWFPICHNILHTP